MDEERDETLIATAAEVARVVAVASGSSNCRSQVGAATIDLEQRTLNLYQFMDNDAGEGLDSLLSRLQYKICLVPNTAGAETCQYATSFHMQGEVMPVDRSTFDDVEGRKMVLLYCTGSEQVLEAEIAGKQYALVAAGALFGFVMSQSTLLAQLSAHSLQLVVNGGYNTMQMDAGTIACLEIFANATGNTQYSLFSFLNRTRTNAGRTFLRTCLFAPSTSQRELIARQDCVHELLQQPDLLQEVADFFQNMLLDFDTISQRLSQTPRAETSSLLEEQIEAVVLLRHCIALLPKLAARLHQCQSDLMRRFAAALSRPVYQKVTDAVQHLIKDEIGMHNGELNFRNTKVFALRDDVDEELQMQRHIYAETVSEMNQMADKLNRRHSYGDSLKLVNNKNRGFHLEISKVRLEERQLHPEFVAVVEERKSVKFTTKEIMQLDCELKHIMQKIFVLTARNLQPLIAMLKESEQMEAINDMKDVIAYLDFLQSLAHVAKEYDLQRPTFSDDTQMKDCANPLFLQLEKMSAGRKVVTNDFHMSKASPLMLITGPNMSGKSGYLRQVALLQIMAQIGSFLPAKGQSHVRVADRILTRIGCDDDLVTNASSFMTEVTQIQYILSKMTADSLVIIDEMGRGTSDEEGVAICVAVSEALLRKKAFTLFATHFHDLVKLQNLYPFVGSYQMEFAQKEAPDGTVFPDFTFKVARRPLDDNKVASVPHGVQLAEKLHNLTALASVARSLFTRIEVYRKELSIQVTDLKRQLLLAMQLHKMAQQPHGQVTTKLAAYLQTMKNKSLDAQK